jgi:hypothetical protein
MFGDIQDMQEKTLPQDKKLESDNLAKRTTIILEKEDREFIDKLIREGKEPGIKSLISKMLEIYKSLTIYEWHFPGEYYCGISRIALLNVELVNILVQNISEEKFREVGRKMGEVIKVSLEASFGIQTAQQENWLEVFKRLKIQGFGDLNLKDKYILIKSPIINEVEVWAGLLQELLKVELQVKTYSPPFVFEVKLH